MGAKSKRKGNEGEREFLQLLKDRGIDAQRNDQTFKGGTDNPDIGARIGGRAFHFEVKRTERFRLYDAVEQAQSDANGHRMPVVAHRMNRKPWVVVLTLEDFMQLADVDPVCLELTAQESAELDLMMEEWSKESEKLLLDFNFDDMPTFQTP